MERKEKCEKTTANLRIMKTHLISLIQLHTIHQLLQQHMPVLIPQLRPAVLVNVFLTTRDHLICDLDEEGSHALGGVVIAGNAVDHLDGVDETRDGGDHADGVGAVEGVAEAFEGVEVFDVVLVIREGV